ncbi:SGNH/GDSL hydrolase family protein [Ornithinibacillus gellani]|uniref:SGNH/GDSL hydrolase family protein n=1 Tax=Ornithinibacillus gellani TaxID=2293253 RepID=UPI000F4A670C|nr:SGNH/GDSL hydrolase family protein [Ornithinibacillus gellani]TQS72079.1 SGNH/GDSL hydrolase family protein [Ornithinibacillus gellani]
MKKAALIIAAVLIAIIGAALLFYLVNDSKDVPKTAHPKQPSTEEDQDTEANEDIDKSTEPPEEEEGQSLRTLLRGAVQSAFEFFTNKETSIVAIGDSLTEGVGDSTGQGGYVGILDRTINERAQLVQFNNFGRRGDRTDQLLTKLELPQVIEAIEDADMVLITIGANDIMQVVKENFSNLTYNQFAQERIGYESRLETIFQTIRDINKDTSIYLIGFYNPFTKYFPEIKELGLIVDDWNQTGKKITEEFDDVHFIPTKDLFLDADVELFADDHFHPNDEGYQRMAKRVLEYLTEQER